VVPNIPTRGTTEFVYDTSGHRVSTWNAPAGSLNEGNVYWNGKPVAFIAGGSTHFEHQDWQGTERLRTSYNGAVDSNYVSLPFGDGYQASGSVRTSSGTNEYSFDAFGHRVSSWVTASNFGNEGRIYWDGKQIAYRSLNGQTFFEHQDVLGTERLRTNYQGAVASIESSLAFGDGLKQNVALSGSDQDNNQFAGQEYDAESSSQHATFRQYSSTLGRWMSPDAYDGSYNINDPQSLNRYTYASNSPLSYIDPDGTLSYIDADGTSDEDPCHGDSSGCKPPAPSPPPPGLPAPPSGPVGGPSDRRDPPGQNGGSAPSNTPSTAPPQPCSVARALAAVRGAAPTGVNTPVDGHLEVGVSLSEATLLSNNFGFYQGPFGANGYRRGNVIVSGHVNATSGQLTPGAFSASPDGIVNAQIHFDTFNPASGLFGLIGHTIYDYTIGKLFFKNSAGLDQGCTQ
jgi:RHS repeat-associated protein